MSATQAIPKPSSALPGEAINHIYCCNPDLALCGVDVSTHPVVDLDDADCVVCLDLEDQTCPTCGQ